MPNSATTYCSCATCKQWKKSVIAHWLTGDSNQCVKLCIALISAWMGADSAAALKDAI